MSKRKLLLADDSITIQKVVNLTFADEGIEVIAVGDGDSALQKIGEFAPDLVLADVNMPGLSGYQICERLKSDAATEKIPVILLVGSFEPFDEAEAYRVGADDYLTKPFQSIRQLVSKVSDLLEAKNGAEETPSAEKDDNASLGESTIPDMPFVDANESEQQNDPKSAQMDDAAMDDELIQTSQIGSLPTDEAQRFMTDAPQRSETTENQAGASFDAEYDAPREYAAESNTAESASAGEDFTRSSFDDDDKETGENKRETGQATAIYNYVDETIDSERKTDEYQVFSLEQTPETEQTEDEAAAAAPNEMTEDSITEDEKFSGSDSRSSETETAKPAAASSGLMFDDMDLLELPSFRPHSSFENASTGAAAQTARAPEMQTSETTEKSGGAASERVNQFARLSPEMIEALAQKVSEKISDKVIREIAWELVPQLTATLMKKMSEERAKE